MGPSMLPTLRAQGDWIIHDRVSHRLPYLSSIPIVSSLFSSSSPSPASVSSPSHMYGRRLQDREADNIPNIQRGTLVIYTSPLDRTRTVCKRLIGLPGDTVCVDPFPDPPPSSSSPDSQSREPDDEDTRVLTETESKVKLKKNLQLQHIVVPPGHFWAMGDNRAATRDSTTYGPVPFGLLCGQARAIVTVSDIAHYRSLKR